MNVTFDVIGWLSGLTNFTFDKEVLKRVMWERDIAGAESIKDITRETKLLCKKDLLITVICGPWSTASYTIKHGDFQEQFGQQTITSDVMENLKQQIRDINKELGLDEEDGLPTTATNTWINEDQWDF